MYSQKPHGLNNYGIVMMVIIANGNKLPENHTQRQLPIRDYNEHSREQMDGDRFDVRHHAGLLPRWLSVKNSGYTGKF